MAYESAVVLDSAVASELLLRHDPGRPCGGSCGFDDVAAVDVVAARMRLFVEDSWVDCRGTKVCADSELPPSEVPLPSNSLLPTADYELPTNCRTNAICRRPTIANLPISSIFHPTTGGGDDAGDAAGSRAGEASAVPAPKDQVICNFC